MSTAADLLSISFLPPFLASAFSPFMAATLFRLVIGNLLLGALEAGIIARFMGVPWRAVAGRAVAANYFSTLVGGFALTILAESGGPRLLGPEPVFGVWRYLGFMIAASLVFSWLLEWLVIRPAFRERHDGGPRSLVATGAAQVVSYLLVIVPLYFVLSSYSLGGLRHAPVAETAGDPATVVYFLAPDGRTLHRVRLDGSQPEKVGDVTGHPPAATELWLHPSEHGADLWLSTGRGATPSREDRVLLKYVASGYPSWAPEMTAQGKAADLRPSGGEWDASATLTEYVPRKGLELHNRQTGERRRVVVDTPFVSWNARAASVLPGDRVLFQLGQQILLADPKGGKLAFVARGHGPVAVPSHLAQQEKVQ